MNKFTFATILILALSSCLATPNNKETTPSWYNSPTQNNSQYLYGVSLGQTLEEATKYALVDAASRLMISISSESSLIREENNFGTNEEIRQKLRQNIEKISFSGFKVTKSQKYGTQIFVEVAIAREPFLREQKDRIEFLEKKISNLNENSLKKNTIQRRNALINIVDLGKELELKSRILIGAGENINLKSKLMRLADFSNQLANLSDEIEFYFELNSPQEITKIIRNALNKEHLKISTTRNQSNQNQVVIRVKSSSRSNKIYEAFLTKLEIDFQNLAENKVVASNLIEVTGSSTISEKESKAAALNAFSEEIKNIGILKIIGIYN